MGKRGRMKERNKKTASGSRGALEIAAVIVSLVAITLFAYGEILGLFFTGADAITLVETGRIGDAEDFGRIVARPLMDGTGFTRVLLYYRPVTSLSYGLDYLFWNLNPLGYHLTDLILHMTATILIFFLTLGLADCRKIWAWLAAALFAIHPIHVEVVPVVSRRQDPLAASLMLLSLIAFMRYASGKSTGRRGLYLSLALYVLALGAKELALLLPLLLGAYVLIFGAGRTIAKRAVEAVKAVAPFLVLTAAWIGWRVYVLGGMGGFVGGRLGASPIDKDPGAVFSNFFLDLIYPLGGVIERTVPGWVALAFGGVAIAALALSAARRGRTIRGGESQKGGKATLWLLVCIAAPFVLFVWTGTFTHRTMYFPTAAFSILVALSLGHCADGLWSLVRNKLPDKRSMGYGDLTANTLTLAILSVLVAFLLAFSPLALDCQEWLIASNSASLLFDGVDAHAATFPNEARLEFVNLPSRVVLAKYRAEHGKYDFPQAREVAVLGIWSVRSWLNLKHPEKHFDVSIVSRAEIRHEPVKLDLEISRGAGAGIIQLKPVYYVLQQSNK